MVENRRKTSVDLTSTAQKVKDEFVYLGLKNLLSAGLILFSQQSGNDKLKALAESNGLESKDAAEEAAIHARICIKTYQSLSQKDFAVSLQFLSDEESRGVRAMLATFAPSLEEKKGRSRKAKPT